MLKYNKMQHCSKLVVHFYLCAKIHAQKEIETFSMCHVEVTVETIVLFLNLFYNILDKYYKN